MERFMIENWMVTREKLSGNCLVCYAYLYAATNGCNEPYTGGYEQLAQDIGVTIPTVYNVLKKLSVPNRPLIDCTDMNSIRCIVRGVKCS